VTVDADRPLDGAVFKHSLLIARFDQHDQQVVWRGGRAPSDYNPFDLLRGATGHPSPETATVN
jgi:hypothetical protein